MTHTPILLTHSIVIVVFLTIGVRDTKLFDAIVYGSSSTSASGSGSGGDSTPSGRVHRTGPFDAKSSRSILLDTTCVREHVESLSTHSTGSSNTHLRESLTQSLTTILRQLRTNGFSDDVPGGSSGSTGSMSMSARSGKTSESQQSMESDIQSLAQYYRQLQSIKFILSPSQPYALSHCEWEAMAAGAIPILDAVNAENPSIKSLFKDLPVLYIKSWSTATPQYLESQYVAMTAVSTNSGNWAAEKLFFPYWLDKLTIHLISGIHTY